MQQNTENKDVNQICESMLLLTNHQTITGLKIFYDHHMINQEGRMFHTLIAAVCILDPHK